FIEPANVAEALRDADWVSAMQEELDQFARLKVWRLVPRPEGKSDFTVFQMDVKTAFFNEILKEKVYVGQPPDFVSKQYPDHVHALDKALYGLKQAPQAWYNILSQFLIESGFQKEIKNYKEWEGDTVTMLERSLCFYHGCTLILHEQHGCETQVIWRHGLVEMKHYY
nr:hypothetical protein [Tanacetum cinerariifolium]